MLKTTAPEYQARSMRGDQYAADWLRQFYRLSEQLGFRINGCGQD